MYVCNRIYFFISAFKLFLMSYTVFTLPFLHPLFSSTLSLFSMFPIYLGDFVLFFFITESMYVSLGSSLLSKLSGVVDYKLVFLYFISRSHL